MRFLAHIIAAVSLLLATASAQASFGGCYGSSSTCCTEINFESLPGYNNASGLLAAGALINRYTFADAGVELWLDEKVVRASDKTLYPIGLVNSSSIPTGEQWGQLKSVGEGLVLTLLDTLVPIRPQRSSTSVANPYTLHLRFSSPAKGTLACVSSVRALRTYENTYRMSLQATAFDEEGDQMGVREAVWKPSTPAARDNTIDLDVTIPEVAGLDLTWIGFGYGAVASIRFCFPNSKVDACGICGGNGSVCGIPANSGPKPGQACVNDSMSNPICRPGRWDDAMRCVPNLYNVSKEVCNGLDDDCDGVVDNNATVAPISCGIGACRRTVYQCGYTGEAFNTTCVPGTPTLEVCDGIDNDCDGLVDEDHVCDRPVEGVPVIPVGVCVSGRLATPRGKCYARFGFFSRDPVFNVTLPYPSDVNAITFSSSAPALWAPTSTEWPQSNFTAGSHSTNSFNVEIPACSGVSAKVTWQLGDGRGNYLKAELDADTAPPCETSNYTSTTDLALPITPMLDEPCVRRVSATGTCAVMLGYYNPNANAPQAYVAVGSPGNYFYFAGGAAGLNLGKLPAAGLAPPPNLFFPGRVKSAYEATWLCPQGTEALHWVLTSGAHNKTKEAIASTMCAQGK